MDEIQGDYRFDEGAVADYDQIKAAAMEKLRGSHGFILVAAAWENDEDMKLVVTSGTTKMDPVVFMALSQVEVAKLMKRAVLAAVEHDVEELDNP